MDVCFDLIIPEAELDSSSLLKKMLVDWVGEQYSHDPAKYKGLDSISFTRRSIPSHILKHLPKEFNSAGWACLTLDEGFLGCWEEAINRSNGKIPEVPLKLLLSQLLEKLYAWAIVFELNCDQIDGVFRLSPSDLLGRIEGALNWNNEPEGFIAWCNNN